MNKPVLMMPYVKQCKTNPTKEQQNAALKAIQVIIDKGYVHNDLDWRHVGYYYSSRKNKNLQALFFDLTSVKHYDNKEAALTLMKKQLGLDIMSFN